MTSDRTPILLIPVEIKVRELDAKILQACSAAESGFRVLIGDQNRLLHGLASLPTGLYLDKSIARPKVKAFDRLTRLGYKPVAWCEEGLVYRNRVAYLNERVAPRAFEAAAAFFAWGQVQRDDIAGHVDGDSGKIHCTGNPRFDLLRPELRTLYEPAAEELRSRYGRFLLVNTNFGRFNHFFGPEKVLDLLRARGSIASEEDEAFFRGWVTFLGGVFNGFVDLVPRLARAFPDLTVVLRPHPSEQHDRWRSIARGIPNLKVVHEGSVIPWLLAAEASVQNSCTTGVEAALLGRPVFAYRPARSDLYDSFLPNRVSVEAATFDDLRDGIAATLAGQYMAPLTTKAGVRLDLGRYVSALDGPLAADRITGVLRGMVSEVDYRTGDPTLARIRDKAERAMRGLARRVLAPFRKTEAYSRQKFSGLAQQEVLERVLALQAVTGRFARVQVSSGPCDTILVEVK